MAFRDKTYEEKIDELARKLVRARRSPNSLGRIARVTKLSSAWGVTDEVVSRAEELENDE